MNQVFILLTTVLIASVIAEAPYRSKLQALPKKDIYSSSLYASSKSSSASPYPTRLPHSEYGLPEVKVVLPPKIKTEYIYDIQDTPKPALPVLSGPYPARVVVPHQEYGLPEIKVDAPKLTGQYPTPVNAPHSEYGPPEIKVVPAPLIKTEYTYDIPEILKSNVPYPLVPSDPYPARVVVPYQDYGLPEIKVVKEPPPIIKIDYNYDLLETAKPALPVSSGPYPSRVVVPHQEYGLPEIKVDVPKLTGHYPTPVNAPHSEYGPPEIKVVPAPLINTEYTYDIPEILKATQPYPLVPSGPYPAHVVVPHQDYSLPGTKVVAPPNKYGLPADKLVPASVINTEYAYEIPQTPAPASIPYPAHVLHPVVPQQEYGPPVLTGPYPTRVKVPHSEYGL